MKAEDVENFSEKVMELPALARGLLRFVERRSQTATRKERLEKHWNYAVCVTVIAVALDNEL